MSQERELQRIFNVLMAAGVLELDTGNDFYLIHRDPFYITDKEWAEMQREFDEEV